MKKHASLALLLVLSAALLAGCRSPMDNGMTDPINGDGSPTVSTTLPDGTLMTEPTTMPTEPSREETQPSQDLTEPGTTQDPSDPSGTTDMTQDPQARRRGLPRY